MAISCSILLACRISRAPAQTVVISILHQMGLGIFSQKYHKVPLSRTKCSPARRNASLARRSVSSLVENGSPTASPRGIRGGARKGNAFRGHGVLGEISEVDQYFESRTSDWHGEPFLRPSGIRLRWGSRSPLLPEEFEGAHPPPPTSYRMCTTFICTNAFDIAMDPYYEHGGTPPE